VKASAPDARLVPISLRTPAARGRDTEARAPPAVPFRPRAPFACVANAALFPGTDARPLGPYIQHRCNHRSRPWLPRALALVLLGWRCQPSSTTWNGEGDGTVSQTQGRGCEGDGTVFYQQPLIHSTAHSADAEVFSRCRASASTRTRMAWQSRESVLFIGTPSVTLALSAFTATTVLAASHS
jgi:hypothetical protein